MAPIKSFLLAGFLAASALSLPMNHRTNKAADSEPSVCMIEQGLCKGDAAIPAKPKPIEPAVCMIEHALCKGDAAIPAQPEPIVSRGKESKEEKARKEA
jgi:hypothetical protein